MDPTIFVAGGLLALILGVAIFDDDDDNDNDQSAETSDGATEGDDTITEYEPGTDEDSTLSTLGGDDLVQLDGLTPTTVDLGTGNDTLEGRRFTDVDIIGGEGSDDIILDVDDPVVIDAGAGDDHVTLTHFRSQSYDYDVYIDAGEGNDTISLESKTAADGVEDGGDLWIEGGAGNDVYEFTLVTSYPAVVGGEYDSGPESLGYNAAATIQDFESGVDRLVVDPTTQAGDATYTGFEIHQPSDATYQQVVFHYTHPDYPEGMAIAISVNGDPIVESDVEVVSSQIANAVAGQAAA